MLAAGRSGTGKTTCALLRLFSAEILFKWEKKRLDQINKDEKSKFGADDVLIASGLHSVFVTASPVLTMEVSRYYDNLSKKIMLELNKVHKIEEDVKPVQEPEEDLDKELNALDEMDIEEKLNVPKSI